MEERIHHFGPEKNRITQLILQVRSHELAEPHRKGRSKFPSKVWDRTLTVAHDFNPRVPTHIHHGTLRNYRIAFLSLLIYETDRTVDAEMENSMRSEQWLSPVAPHRRPPRFPTPQAFHPSCTIVSSNQSLHIPYSSSYNHVGIIDLSCMLIATKLRGLHQVPPPSSSPSALFPGINVLPP